MSASSVVISGHSTDLQKVQSGALFCYVQVIYTGWTQTTDGASYIYTATTPLVFPTGVRGSGNSWEDTVRYIQYNSPADAHTYFLQRPGVNHLATGVTSIAPVFCSASASAPAGTITIFYSFIFAASKQNITYF